MSFERSYDFTRPFDDLWEVLPTADWSFDRGRLINRGAGNAEIYLRPCSIYGDRLTWTLAPGATHRGMFAFGFIAGFEYIRVELDLATGALRFRTHEFHKAQPRLVTSVRPPTQSIELIRERDDLPGLPYEGSRITLLIDGADAASLGHIDYLPESLVMFGLHGPGELALKHWTIAGPSRPRPEYVHIGAWQQGAKSTTRENVNALLVGVREAAQAGVKILATPETSLTGLRPDSPELSDRAAIAAELARFQKAVAEIPNAPYTLVGYPDWIPGSTVDGSELDQVKVNCHRFVRPDGALGPPMAKVHSCEEGLWHGRHYNLQRVAGVEVAVGICHDGHYQDVWATGVMGGARLCIHAAAGGTTRKGKIEDLRKGITHNPGTALESFWMHVNAYGPTTIYYPVRTARIRDPLLAICKELTEQNPTYPDYSSMGDQLTHARIRLWDASGAYPLRTLRSGKQGYETWSRLVPPIVDV